MQDAETECRRVTHHISSVNASVELSSARARPQVWNPEGTLIGKFFLGTTAANLVFAGDGRLVILAETAVYLAEIAAKFNKVSFP